MHRINIILLATVSLFVGLVLNTVLAQDQTQQASALRKAYKKLLTAVDYNKDGKLSIEECYLMWKDRAAGEHKCKSWDTNGNGIITEEEYVQQELIFMK